MAINEDYQPAKNATQKQPKSKQTKDSGLAVNEQATQSTELSVASAQKDGQQLAVKEMQGFALGYARASQGLTQELENQLQVLRSARNAAISNVPVEAEDSDFLEEFKQGLSSLLAPAD